MWDGSDERLECEVSGQEEEGAEEEEEEEKDTGELRHGLKQTDTTDPLRPWPTSPRPKLEGKDKNTHQPRTLPRC